ncbi:MAG: hypothetical protein M1831_001514 [Alyxoria varia]|nr:MAG: hypothetical protein M1831_001514 [Alyxoria varia]
MVPANEDQDSPFWYTFKVQCTSCRETHPNWVGVNRFESNQQPGSRGEANFVWKCRLCNRSHTANITGPPNPYRKDSSTPPHMAKKPQPLLTIDCRGLEFIAFDATQGGTWESKGTDSGTKFTGIKFETGDDGAEEWYDYDEKAGEEVWIKECKWDIARA